MSLNSVSEVPICNLHTKVLAQTLANVVIELENDHEKLCTSPTIEKQRDQETSILEALNLFNVNVKNVDIPPNKENVYFLQNDSLVNELLLEIKDVIGDIEDVIKKSDVTLAMPHIHRLKRIRNCLEKMFHNEIHKSTNYINFDKLVENCVICIKKLVSKQECIINSVLEKADLSIKGNKNLNSKIIKLRDLLQSCGFLKFGSDKKNEPENIFSFDTFTLSNSNEVFICDIAHDPMLKRIIVPLLPVLNSAFSKLVNINEKMLELQFIFDCTQKFNNNLISRVKDQEMHLKGVTKEIEEAQHIVSDLKNEHKKLQYAEGVLKYDLQEKRKLLTRLRKQLENTREDFSRVRIKNSKSEAEWQDLHNEFLLRHRESDAKTDFPNDKCLNNLENENYNHNSTASDECLVNDPPETFSSDEYLINDPPETISSAEYLVNDPPETVSSDVPHTKTRLELLEEQCQNLYSSLLLSSRKRQAIDEHLDNICQRIEKRNKMCSDNFSIHCSNENDENDTEIAPLKSDCQSTMLKCNDFANSSNKVESSCNQNMSSNNFDLNSSKTDSCVPYLPELQFDIPPIAANDQIHESNCSSNSVFLSNCSQESAIAISSEAIGLTVNDKNVHAQCISPEDSVLIVKEDIAKCLNLEIDNKTIAGKIKEVSYIFPNFSILYKSPNTFRKLYI